MISATRLAPAALLALTLALGACSPSATTPPTPSAAANALSFQGTAQAAVETLTARGFACDPEPPRPLPTNGTAADKVYTRICHLDPPEGQVTEIYLYALRSDGSIAGIGIEIAGHATDQAVAAQAAAQETASAIALVFPAPAATIVETAVTNLAGGDGKIHAVSPSVQVLNQSQGTDIRVEVWGPEMVAAGVVP